MNRRDFLKGLSVFIAALGLPVIKIAATDVKEIVDGNLILENEDKIVDTNAVNYIPIYSQEDLEKIGFDKNYPINGNYIQMNNIFLNNEFKMIGREEPFSGTFDGL